MRGKQRGRDTRFALKVTQRSHNSIASTQWAQSRQEAAAFEAILPHPFLLAAYGVRREPDRLQVMYVAAIGAYNKHN